MDLKRLSPIRIFRKIKKNPWIIFVWLGIYGFLGWVPDNIFLKLVYRGHTGRKLDLEDPQRYTEKLQWLKLYDRNPLHTTLVDKYEVRNYLKGKVDDCHIVKLYGVYENFGEIDWDALPNEFIMKNTQGSGSNYVVLDKDAIDKGKLKNLTKKWFKQDLYKRYKEWPYKNVKPRIIVEELLLSGHEAIIDYKFYCFNGIIGYCGVQYYIGKTKYQNFFDKDYNHLEVECSYLPCSTNQYPVQKPKYYESMVSIAQKLSKNFKHVRIDFLGTDSNFYMGEFTFFTASGFSEYIPDSFDFEMGKLIKL